MNRFLKFVVLVGVFCAFMGCGASVGVEGIVVGGPCVNSTDCDGQSRCLRDDDFPEGTCAVNCSSHEDCPDGTRCVDKEGGVCLLNCELPSDCRGGYTCKGKKNESGGGESLVCIE